MNVAQNFLAKLYNFIMRAETMEERYLDRRDHPIFYFLSLIAF
jgi:hypothetical protein